MDQKIWNWYCLFVLLYVWIDKLKIIYIYVLYLFAKWSCPFIVKVTVLITEKIIWFPICRCKIRSMLLVYIKCATDRSYHHIKTWLHVYIIRLLCDDIHMHMHMHMQYIYIYVYVYVYVYVYTAHKKFMNTSTSAESMASFILEGRYLENQTP